MDKHGIKWRRTQISDLRKREMEHVETIDALRDLETAASSKGRYWIENQGWKNAMLKAYETVYGEIIGCAVELNRLTAALAKEGIPETKEAESDGNDS